MNTPNWTSVKNNLRLSNALSAVDDKIKQLNRILQKGNRILKEANSKSEYSAFCIQRFLGSSFNRFVSTKLEILVNARSTYLKQSKHCDTCITVVMDLLKSPSLTFDKLETNMTVILSNVAISEKYELESNSDTATNELIECINKTKEESRELEAAMKLSKEVSAKLKDQLNKTSGEGNHDVIIDKADLEKVQLAAKEITDRISQLLDDLKPESALYLSAGINERAVLEALAFVYDSYLTELSQEVQQLHKANYNDCVDCFPAQVEKVKVEFESSETRKHLLKIIKGVKDVLDPTHNMEQTSITQELKDKEKATCPICLDDLPIGFTSALSCFGCHQVFDKDCISRWLSENRKCPHCRQELRAEFMNMSETLEQLYLLLP